MPDMGLDILFKGQNFMRLMDGLANALYISLVSVGLSIPLGMLFGIVMTSKNKVVRFFCRLYLEIVRIMPQMVLLFLVFFGSSRAFGVDIVKVNRNLYKKDNQKMYSFGHSRNNAGCGVAEGLQR